MLTGSHLYRSEAVMGTGSQDAGGALAKGSVLHISVTSLQADLVILQVNRARVGGEAEEGTEFKGSVRARSPGFA